MNLFQTLDKGSCFLVVIVELGSWRLGFRLVHNLLVRTGVLTPFISLLALAAAATATRPRDNKK